MKPEYIIRDTNGNVFSHGHSSSYAWNKFNKMWNYRGGLCMKRREMEELYLSRHDGKEHKIGSFGKSINHGDYEIQLFLIAH